MTKKQTKKPSAKPASDVKLDNGVYAETLLGGAPGTVMGSQLSQTDTLEKIIRGYLITNNFLLLCRLYAEVGIIQNFIDIPVQHALKGGFEMETKQLSAEEIAELMEEIETHKDLEEIQYAMIWKRLFGGGGLVTLDRHNPDADFKMENIQQGDKIEFKAADLWELNSNVTIADDYKPGEMDRLLDGDKPFFYYGKKLASSRVKILKGKRAPSHIRAMLRGWGLSEVEDVIRSINQYIKTGDLTFEVMDEFKIDVYKFKGLATSLASKQGQALIQERITTANMQKSYQNGVALDAEDEFDHKNLSFAGLAEIMMENKKNVSADLRIPITILFGQSAAGFNSGEDDIENFNSMIESSVRPEALHLIKYIVKVRCLTKFGIIPQDLKVTLKPLREMSSLDVETMKTQQYTRLSGARAQGDIDTKEYREAANKQSLFGIQLDENKEMIQETPELDEDQDDAEKT